MADSASNRRRTPHRTTGLPDRPQTVDEALRLGRRPLVIAHRGGAGLAPENTLASFRRAAELGADMVELDVQLSRDGYPIVLHDSELERTTDGRGPAADRDLAALRRLDAGRWHSPAFVGERIPRLREVLEAVGRQLLVNIEIKREAVAAQTDGGIAERVAREVRDCGLEARVIVSSFEPRALLQMREVAPEIATASLYDEKLHRGLDPIEIMDRVGSRAFNLSRRQVDAAIVERCHARGRSVGVYTVDRTREMRALVALGVDALFTDRPDRLIALLAERRAD